MSTVVALDIGSSSIAGVELKTARERVTLAKAAVEPLPPGLVHFEIQEPLDPHPVIDRLTYRAIREALGNAIRHAEATSIVVRISQDDAGVAFEVVDDGVGFDTTRPTPEGHMGMRLISEMVANAGGTMSTLSSVGQGTRVKGELPLGAH